jgi:DnaJ like chaperone protein
MAWWGKVLGGAFGFLLGGPLGAVLGAALGHGFDRGLAGMEQTARLDPGEQERVQTAFFTATFSVLGHLAKADGRVSPQEIGLTETLMAEMELSADMRRTAMRLFNQGKAAEFPLNDVLEQFRSECHRRHNLLRMFLEIQVQAAYVDGRVDPAEQRLLGRIAAGLGFTAAELRWIDRLVRARAELGAEQARHGGRATAQQRPPNLDTAYAVLDVSPDASDAEVKKSYRRLLNQHHPDKLVSKGLPEEMMKIAAQKTHEIKQAYEIVKQSRGMR